MWSSCSNQGCSMPSSVSSAARMGSIVPCWTRIDSSEFRCVVSRFHQVVLNLILSYTKIHSALRVRLFPIVSDGVKLPIQAGPGWSTYHMGAVTQGWLGHLPNSLRSGRSSPGGPPTQLTFCSRLLFAPVPHSAVAMYLLKFASSG